MEKLKNIFIISSLFTSVLVSSQENLIHLEPLDRTFMVSDLYSKANFRIKQNLETKKYHPIICFIKVPSFSDDDVLDLFLDKEKYYLIYTQFEKRGENDIEKRKIYKTEIDSISANQIECLFLTAIYETRYIRRESEESLALDGTTFFFFINDVHFTKGGQTWSPAEDSPMGKLVSICNKLIEFAKKEELVSFNKVLINKIEDLKKELIKQG